MPGGHAPWLVDAQHVAGLIAAHSRFMAGPAAVTPPGADRLVS
jgi:hypothetical protein